MPVGSFDLYSTYRGQVFSNDLFQDPPAVYRGVPFWSWNCSLEEKALHEQLDAFSLMGFGGADIHPRTGLATQYLGTEYMDLVKSSVAKCKQLGLAAWLYDEDRWPSGFAGGLVTEDEKHRARHLLFTTKPYGAGQVLQNGSAARWQRTENGRLVGTYGVRRQGEKLIGYRKFSEGDTPEPGEEVWYAYIESAAPSAWFNHATYVNVLSKPAIERFIEKTHEAYKKAVGAEFGAVVPAIFTDEPQLTCAKLEGEDTRIVAFAEDFFETFAAAFGTSIEYRLPEIFFKSKFDGAAKFRWQFYEHLTERFASAYADTIGNWCQDNGIALTGHYMCEPGLREQTDWVGEVMRHHRSFHIPGIDMLCDWREFTTVKQAVSVARQYGRTAVMSELYGVMGWDLDFTAAKCHGDWQLALGVTVRVPHLSWVSMAGEAKRDYPASIAPQSPWWKEWKLLEDHCSRVGYALTRGRPLVRVAMIHPVESEWIGEHIAPWPPPDKKFPDAFAYLTAYLSTRLLDVDFVAESLLAGQNPRAEKGRLVVGQSAYEAVVVTGRTIRKSTLDALVKFANSGGRVIFWNAPPKFVDATHSDRCEQLAQDERRYAVVRDEKELLAELRPYRDVWSASPAELVCGMREDGEERYLMVCQNRRDETGDGTFFVRGMWDAQVLDTLTGEVRTAEVVRTLPERGNVLSRDGVTEIAWQLHGASSVLLRLKPARGATPEVKPEEKGRRDRGVQLAAEVAYSLSEPNALLLDQARWRVNGGEWKPREEVLRIDNAAREIMGLPLRTGNDAQPWADKRPDALAGVLELAFNFDSAVRVEKLTLALERAASTGIMLDGKPVSRDAIKPGEYWVDHSIGLVDLGTLEPGEHELVLTIPMSRSRDVEWAYLLGDFGVAVHGNLASLTRRPATLDTRRSWTEQGLPFYTGNVVYHFPLEGRKGPTELRLPRFKGFLATASIGGKRVGTVAAPPLRCNIGELDGSPQVLDVTVYGNRHNAFGWIHNTDRNLVWKGPQAWRSKKDWTTAYELIDMGLMATPIVANAT